MSNGFALSTELLPLPVGSGPRLNNAVPSVQSHYRTFTPTTNCSVPVPRIGTTGSHVPYKSPVRLRAAYMPDAAWAVFRITPKLIPGEDRTPGFDTSYGISTPHQRFAFARLSGPYLTGSGPAFSATFTTTALDDRSLQRFAAGT